ncbi:hypothetical protein ACE6H2_000715 [Prunus campanulata]
MARNQGVDVENFLHNLHRDLRRDTKWEDPLDEMMFITHGKVLAYSSNTCGKGANSLKKGDFSGEELLD